MRICRKCGFIKSDLYEECPDCGVKLDEFEEFEGEEE